MNTTSYDGITGNRRRRNSRDDVPSLPSAEELTERSPTPERSWGDTFVETWDFVEKVTDLVDPKELAKEFVKGSVGAALNAAQLVANEIMAREAFFDRYDRNGDRSVDTVHDIPDRVTGDRDYSSIC